MAPGIICLDFYEYLLKYCPSFKKERQKFVKGESKNKHALRTFLNKKYR